MWERLREPLRTKCFAETQRPSPQPSPRKYGERERRRRANSAVARYVGAMNSEKTATILVVDDVAENRDLLARRLQRLGFTAIDQAQNGHEALAAIAATYGAP